MATPKPFRAVWHLLLTHDSSRVDRGEIEAPWVDQAAFDFDRLRDVLQGITRGPDVTVRVPNDTIDLVTIDERKRRYDGIDTSEIRCLDFAKRLRLEARKQEGPVIDVSCAWAGRHTLANRLRVPPPMVLPMLVEADDYVDMQLARVSTMVGLGMFSEHPLDWYSRRFSGEGREEEPEAIEGELPEALHQELESLFGVDFALSVLLDEASLDPLPVWARPVSS